MVTGCIRCARSYRKKVPETDAIFANKAWWASQTPEACARVTHRQRKADNGPESQGRRTPFLKRRVEFAGMAMTPASANSR